MSGAWNGNYYYGDAGNDIATGTDANNGMWGEEGNDNLDGAGGNDNIDGGVGSDDLQGGDGNDILWDVSDIPWGFSGIIGHDTLRGGAGDDHLNFWSPDTGDVANGGAGVDTLEVRFNWPYGSTPTNLPISFVLGTAPSVIYLDQAPTVSVSNIEKMLFVSGNGNDFIAGGDFNDTIAGEGGNDVLRGNGGDDWLEGGAGIQDIDGGADYDVASFDLSAASDSITVDTGRGGKISLGAWGTIKNCERLYDFATGSGADVVTLNQALGASMRLGFGDDRATLTGLGGDHVEAGYGNDTINSGAGGDYVDPGGGADLVHLGDGNDYLDYVETGSRGSTEADTVYGEAGEDAIYTAAGADRLEGGLDNDTLYAGGGADQVIGGDGNDIIQGEAGADTLTGGDGNDSISADYDYWTDLTPQDSDKLTGGLGNDSLSGGVGQDTLDGGEGDDFLTLSQQLDTGTVGDALLDKAMGGAGVDTLQVNASQEDDPTRYRLVLGATTRVQVDGLTVATATSMERLIFYAYYNAGDHVFQGGDLGDAVYVGAGDSLLTMLGGNDTVYTGAGSDTLDAGAGEDSVTGFIAGKDKLQLGDGADYLLLYDYQSSADASIGGAVYDGGAGADRLELSFGSLPGSTFDGRNIRVGDTVVGVVKNFEAIKYYGAAYEGVYNGGNGAETVTLSQAATVNGGGGDDTVNGSSGADLLRGDAGGDRLCGLGGNDTLVGGTGADRFLFNSTPNGVSNFDVIDDFTVGQDRIELNSSVFTWLFDGKLPNYQFHVGTEATNASHRIIYDDATGNLYYDTNGDGAGGQTLFAVLDAGLALTAGDIWVV
ncbi:MAG TPA: calcium-binding protein [Caulobacteraceae bacterium]|jgi:Ca2+-binding RTX toxin-like protein